MSTVVDKIKDKVAGTSIPSGQHLAAILPSQGSSLEIVHRPTPKPGPNELLIEVKSIALNPVDWKQIAWGVAIASYPAILGSDVAGTVLSTGSSVPADAPQPGTRVAAFAPCFFAEGAPDYGAFQTRVLVPASNVVPLPQGFSFNDASLLPMAVLTAMSGWNTNGVPRSTAYTAADKKGVLVWGGASSIGSAAIQTANLMGFAVYATASEKHHTYLKSLGASKLFDYRDEDVVRKIVKAVEEDGVSLQLGYDAVGQVQSCVDVLKELKGEGTARLAAALPLSEDSPKAEGVEVKFIAPLADETQRTEFSNFVFRVWLKEALENGKFVPSPKIKVIEGGLEAVNKGLDELKKGVSGLKLVLEV
ncbi:MAG: hypothetical protein M1818_008330 [Claussenomyces sp. TS43310]|nr:MAG: hypothetical protein M1818_008330 [Claussenomyces sp. TS43310]